MSTVAAARPWYRRRWVLDLAGLVLVIGLVPVGWQVYFRLTHPAPLGRSAAAIDQRLAQLLPSGTALDSVTRVLDAVGADFSVMEADDPALAQDSLAVGGPVIQAAARDIDADLLFHYAASIRLAFDSSRRLVRRRVEDHVTGM